MAIARQPKESKQTQAAERDLASSFLNLQLPLKDGTTTKLASVPLRLSNEIEKKVHEHLASFPEGAERDAALQQLKDRLVIQFNVVRDKSKMELDL